MKKLMFIFALAFAFSSCSSESEAKIENSDLFGKWNWTLTKGGIAGEFFSPASTQTSLQVILNADYSYSIIKNDIEVSNGKHELIMEDSQNFQEKRLFIHYSKIGEKPSFIVLGGMILLNNESGLLEISEDFMDGFGSEYTHSI